MRVWERQISGRKIPGNIFRHYSGSVCHGNLRPMTAIGQGSRLYLEQLPCCMRYVLVLDYYLHNQCLLFMSSRVCLDLMTGESRKTGTVDLSGHMTATTWLMQPKVTSPKCSVKSNSNSEAQHIIGQIIFHSHSFLEPMKIHYYATLIRWDDSYRSDKILFDHKSIHHNWAPKTCLHWSYIQDYHNVSMLICSSLHFIFLYYPLLQEINHVSFSIS